MLSKNIHRYIYVFSLILLGVSIPFSVFLMSVSQFLLATNWLLELDFRNKWTRIKGNKPALFLIGLFLLHLLWMLNSTNMDYGWHDVKIKLPLFVMALLIGSSQRLTFLELKLILNLFILSVVSASVFSALIYYGIIDREITDVRQISIFISHIRLSLLVNLAIFISYYLGIREKSFKVKIVYLLFGIWLVFFLFILNSYTGLLVFLIVFSFLLLRAIVQKGELWLKLSSLIAILSLLVVGTYLSNEYLNRFYTFDKMPELIDLDKETINGNKYQHNRLSQITENGHYVYLFISQKEIKKEWNKRSSISYKDGLNKKFYPVRFTLINYLTSLNLRKDSVGIAQLSNKDIEMIESGYSNFIYKKKYSLYAKIYPILQQIDTYKKRDYAEGASITQRFEYLKIAKKIIEENFWFGTGTGDVDDAFRIHYANNESVLSQEFQHRAHNQYVTFFISFGLCGFLASLFFMFWPIVYERTQFLPLVFILTAFLSMTNEDTLETQAGITFFTYFYILFFVAFSFRNYQKQQSTEKIDAL